MTSITSTATMRIMKVLPRYQVSVRDGKKSSSTEGLFFLQRRHVAHAVAPPEQRANPLHQLGIAAFERADRLPPGHERHAIVHPEDRRGEDDERAPQGEHRIEPPERSHFRR